MMGHARGVTLDARKTGAKTHATQSINKGKDL